MFELENGCGKGEGLCNATGTYEQKQGGTSRKAGDLRGDGRLSREPRMHPKVYVGARQAVLFRSSSEIAGGEAGFAPAERDGLFAYGYERGRAKVCPACCAELANCQGAELRQSQRVGLQ